MVEIYMAYKNCQVGFFGSFIEQKLHTCIQHTPLISNYMLYI